MIAIERWVDIEGWEGVYQVSDMGRLKSFLKEKYGFVLSNKNSKGDYLSVVLKCKGRKPRYVRMHRLVAEAFIYKDNDDLEVNHKDGNRQNNRMDNLEWVSKSENVRHAIAMRPQMLAGMIHYNQKTKPNSLMQFSLDGEFVRCFSNAAEASKASGVCHRNILQVANKTEYSPGRYRKQAGGFRWENKEVLDVGHENNCNR